MQQSALKLLVSVGEVVKLITPQSIKLQLTLASKRWELQVSLSLWLVVMLVQVSKVCLAVRNSILSGLPLVLMLPLLVVLTSLQELSSVGMEVVAVSPPCKTGPLGKNQLLQPT
jgi:hypothetical protein